MEDFYRTPFLNRDMGFFIENLQFNLESTTHPKQGVLRERYEVEFSEDDHQKPLGDPPHREKDYQVIIRV
jgi:hypothetical protein